MQHLMLRGCNYCKPRHEDAFLGSCAPANLRTQRRAWLQKVETQFLLNHKTRRLIALLFAKPRPSIKCKYLALLRERAASPSLPSETETNPT